MPSPKDLGIDTTAISNATGPLQGGPDLASLLRTLGTQPAQEATQLQGALQQLQQGGEQQPNILEQLLSPAGLAIVAGSLLAGKAGGGAGAAAFGLGGLQGLQGQEAAKQELRAEAIDKLQEQRDKALDRVESAQQRANTIFNTNPDAFIDPETGEPTIDPETLGLLTTGFPIKLFPQTRRRLNQADASQTARHELYGEALKGSDSISDARQILKSMMTNMQWFDVPDGVVDAMARSIGTPEWTPTLANIYVQYGGASALDAFIHAAENKLPLEDPAVLAHIDWQERPATDIDLADKEVSLIERLNKWGSDPANRETLRTIREEVGTDEVKFIQRQIEEAFVEEQGNKAFMLKRLGILGNDFAQYIAAYRLVSDKFDLANRLSGISKLEFLDNLSPEEFEKWKATQASSTKKAMDDAAFRTSASQDAESLNLVKQRLRAELNLGTKATIDVANEVLRVAIEAATRPDGRVDRDKFEAEVERQMRIAIEQIRGQ